VATKLLLTSTLSTTSRPPAPGSDAVIVARPEPVAVTTPWASTRATDASLYVQRNAGHSTWQWSHAISRRSGGNTPHAVIVVAAMAITATDRPHHHS